MNKLRIEKKDIYTIEVNDKGECIEFDLADINLNLKGYQTLEKLEEKMKEIKNSINEFNNKKASEKEFLEFENQAFFELRKIMDNFLGEGACQKIFGDRNYYEMFDDLIDELTKPRKELNGKSHFDMLKITSDGLKERIANKYNKKTKKVL